MVIPLRAAAAVWLAITAALPAGTQAQASAGAETTTGRAVDRLVIRVRNRSDLAGLVGPSFNRDSLDTHAFRGLRRTGDTTIIAWFSGFSGFINSLDTPSCTEMTKLEPSVSSLAAMSSTMDSVALDGWLAHWETAVRASFLEPERPAPDSEAMMGAMFTLLSALPVSEMTVTPNPSGKPRKRTAEQECRLMGEFFSRALAIEEPDRTMLFRALAEMINEPRD